jgi:hypothetical protein
VRDRRPRPDGRLPGPDDVALADRLERALRDEHADTHVDVAQLVRATRQATTKPARVRRFTVLAATGLAAASIPVGLQVAQWSAPTAAPPAGVPTSSPSPEPPPETRPPTPSPAAVAAIPTSEPGGARTGDPKAWLALDGYADTLYDIPDLTIPAGAFPAPMASFDDFGQYRGIPTVTDQSCPADADEPPLPVAGRSWSWAEEASNRLDQYAIVLHVTGWAPGESAHGLADVAANTGNCRFGSDSELKQASLTDDGWTGWTRRPDGVYCGHAVRVLAGDVIVAVSVYSPVGRKDALKQAESLLDVAVDEARRAGVEKLLDDALAKAGKVKPAVTPSTGG